MVTQYISLHTYFTLSPGTRDHYLDYIDTLPLANTPEVFGLHTNAEIGYFTRATKDLWTQLMELQPQTGEAGTGISREEFIGNLASDIEVEGLYLMCTSCFIHSDVYCTLCALLGLFV